MENISPEQTGQTPKYKISALNPATTDQWVTLVSCGTILEGDFVRSRLESEGVALLIPDVNLMSAAAGGLIAYGYVRVQVKPEDYEAARELMIESGDAVAV